MLQVQQRGEGWGPLAVGAGRRLQRRGGGRGQPAGRGREPVPLPRPTHRHTGQLHRRQTQDRAARQVDR